MEQWSEIRRRVLVEGLSKRAACRAYGLHWHTLMKMLEHSEPRGYRATPPRQQALESLAAAQAAGLQRVRLGNVHLLA